LAHRAEDQPDPPTEMTSARQEQLREPVVHHNARLPVHCGVVGE
jgi:hypothetical protein